jgi:hydrogenase maturation protein HypF
MEALLERDMRLAPCYGYSLDDADGPVRIDPAPLIRALLDDLRAGTDLVEISRRFHSTIVDIVCAICLRMRQTHAVQQVVLSGGVFLNEFLLVNSLLRLQALGFYAYCHRTVPTNDGGIALGQVAVAHSIISRTQGTP